MSRFTEFKFGWPVVFASAIGIGLGMSPLPFYTVGVFAGPLVTEFGWSFGQVFSALLVFTFGALFMSPLIGVITDKVGVRPVVLTSIVTFSACFCLQAVNNGSYTLYLSIWFLLAVAGAGTLPITWTRTVNAWFHERRGLALGLALIATGIFGSVAKFVAQALIEAYGWRGAYIGVGLLPLLIAFPIAYFFFHDVEDPKVRGKVERMRVEIPESAGAAAAYGGMRLSRAFRDWRFWLLAYAFFPVSFAVGGPIPNLETILQSKGFDKNTAVNLGVILGPSVVFGRVAGGYLLDRFWAPAVAAIVLSLPAISVLMLAQGDVTMLTAGVAIFVLGMAAGVEYDLMAFIVSRYFGMRHYAAIYGMLYGFFALGAGTAPGVFAAAYDRTGSYDSILTMVAFGFVAGAVPLLLLGRYRKFKGEEPVPA